MIGRFSFVKTQRKKNRIGPSKIAWYKLDGCLPKVSPGNIKAHGTFEKRPGNSVLIKFPNRPQHRAIGIEGAMRSVTLKYWICFFSEYIAIENKTPKSPPWKDMPPCHILKIIKGSDTN